MIELVIYLPYLLSLKIRGMEQLEGQDILNFIKKLPNDQACKA